MSLFSIDHRILAAITIVIVVLLAGVTPQDTAVTPLTTVSSLSPKVLPSVVQLVTSAWSGGNETERWCADLVTGLGFVPGRGNIGSCVAWVQAEGTYMSLNNPLNTTQITANQIGIYNHDGVKIYPDRQTGLEATITTLHYSGHGYEAILDALQSDNGDAVVHAIEVSDWGTGGLATRVWNTIKSAYQ